MLNIGIVGGSISGTAAAIELSRLGHNVTVFERSKGVLKGRGAGISVPLEFIEQLKARDLVDKGLSYLCVNEVPHVGYAEEEPMYGVSHWSAPYPPFAMLNWSELYFNLRKRVPDSCYLQGMKVTAIEEDSHSGSILTLNDSVKKPFDLVVFADGYHSLGRKIIAPESRLKYSEYVLWRGVLPEHELPVNALFDGKLQRLSHHQGHAIFYYVPGLDQETGLSYRRINWGIYLPVPKARLSHFLTDRNGHQGFGSIAPGLIAQEQEQRLKSLAKSLLPAFYADIVQRTEYNFIQAIYTASVSSYNYKNLCIIGDAAAIAQPFTSCGVYKAIGNVIDLVEAMSAHSNLAQALAVWSDKATNKAKNLETLAASLEPALIWSTPNFATMTRDQLACWWDQAYGGNQPCLLPV